MATHCPLPRPAATWGFAVGLASALQSSAEDNKCSLGGEGGGNEEGEKNLNFSSSGRRGQGRVLVRSTPGARDNRRQQQSHCPGQSQRGPRYSLWLRGLTHIRGEQPKLNRQKNFLSVYDTRKWQAGHVPRGALSRLGNTQAQT